MDCEEADIPSTLLVPDTVCPVSLQASHGAMHGSCKHRIDRRSEGDIKKELGTVGALEMQEQLGVIRAVERRGGS